MQQTLVSTRQALISVSVVVSVIVYIRTHRYPYLGLQPCVSVSVSACARVRVPLSCIRVCVSSWQYVCSRTSISI